MFFAKLRLRLTELLARRRAGGGIYYIGGPDVLPQPLSREEESAVIRAMEAGGDGAEEARQTLIERNLRLVAWRARPSLSGICGWWPSSRGDMKIPLRWG